MRQTALSLDQLEVELNIPFSMYEKCLLVNEIGEICLKGDKRAEAILRNLADSDESCLNYVVFCFLSSLVSPDPESVVKIRQFRENPDNEEAVQRAKVAIARFRQTAN